MKNRKLYSISIAAGLLVGGVVWSFGGFKSLGFVAPIVNSSANVSYPEKGEIIFSANDSNLLVNVGTTETPNWESLLQESNKTVVAKTSSNTNDDADPGQDVILYTLSSADVNLNLPEADEVLGKVFLIKKLDATAYTVTITPNGTDSIDGVASTTTKLNTANESLEIMSDGTGWHILSRRIPSVWTPFTPSYTDMGFSSFSTSSGFWRREGDSMRVRVFFDPSGGSGSASSLKLTIPDSKIIDTTKLPGGSDITQIVGTFQHYDDSGGTAAGMGHSAYLTTTSVSFRRNDSVNFATNAMSTTNDRFSAEFIVPISGWNN